MTTIRIEKNKNYTVMSNYHFKERAMSLKAKGLLSLMLSLPDNWNYSVEGLSAICVESGTAIRSALKELEKFKYLVRYRKQNSKGQFEYEYVVFEKPYEDVPKEEEPQEEKPHTENPHTENMQQLNTNKLNTNKLNTKNKESKKEPSGYDDIISKMVVNENVKATLTEFIKMRKLIKKPLTDFALTKLINKLNKLSPAPSKQVEILERSIINNWQDIYELKGDTPSQTKSSFADVAEHIRNNDDTTEEIDRSNLNF